MDNIWDLFLIKPLYSLRDVVTKIYHLLTLREGIN